MDNMRNLNAYEGIKTNPKFRRFEGYGKSILKNVAFIDVEYLVLTDYFSFEVRLGDLVEWDDVLFYTELTNDGSLIYPILNK